MVIFNSCVKLPEGILWTYEIILLNTIFEEWDETVSKAITIWYYMYRSRVYTYISIRYSIYIYIHTYMLYIYTHCIYMIYLCVYIYIHMYFWLIDLENDTSSYTSSNFGYGIWVPGFWLMNNHDTSRQVYFK